MPFLATLIGTAINIYIFVIILHVAVSWLIVFKVLNAENPQAQNLITLLKKLTDPVMKPVQKYVPPIGGIDITPIVVIIALQLLNSLLISLLVSIFRY